MREAVVTDIERFFGDDEIIVSKTNLKGHITYANEVFLSIADFTEKEVLGQPHSMIRHPSMPRSIFKLLWETLEKNQEIFAYVKNRAKNGDHYWVIAHVTPSKDKDGNIVGYHSNRRVPERRILDETIIPLYNDLLKEENCGNKKEGLENSYNKLTSMLATKGLEYDEYIAGIMNN